MARKVKQTLTIKTGQWTRLPDGAEIRIQMLLPTLRHRLTIKAEDGVLFVIQDAGYNAPLTYYVPEGSEQT